MPHVKFQDHRTLVSDEEDFKAFPYIGMAAILVGQRRRQRRRTPGHGHTLSSPCESEGSGELKYKQNTTH